MDITIKENYFSVIIPLYNKRDFVVRAINSVLMQSYKKFEIIIVDDGSTDGSAKVLEVFDDDKINIITQCNMGVSVARNTGAKSSKYNYLVFLDADDVWQSGLLAELNLLVNRYPTAGIYGVNNYFVFANGKKIYEKYEELFANHKIGIIKDYFYVFSKYGKSPFCNSGCCYPKHVFNEMGGYKKGIRLTEDSDLWCRIAFRYAIAYSLEPLTTYFMETPGNTHHVFEPRDFEVSMTLQRALISNSIKPTLVRSVRNLVAFQQLSLVKRAIIAGHRLFSLKKLLDTNLLYCYPFKAACLLIVLILPTRTVQTIRRLMVAG